MKKIGILTCQKMTKTCMGVNCFHSIHERLDSFEQYRDQGFEIVGFGHCNGQCSTGQDGIGARGALFKRMGADIIHLSSCIKLKCPNHAQFFEALSADFTVVDHTHALK